MCPAATIFVGFGYVSRMRRGRAVCAELVEAFELLRTARALTPRPHVGIKSDYVAKGVTGFTASPAPEDGDGGFAFALAPHGGGSGSGLT